MEPSLLFEGHPKAVCPWIKLPDGKVTTCLCLVLTFKKAFSSSYTHQYLYMAQHLISHREDLTINDSWVDRTYDSHLHSTPDIIRAVKSRRKTWAGHVAYIGKRRGAYRFFFWRKLKQRDHSEDLGVDRRKILKWILNLFRGCGLD